MTDTAKGPDFVVYEETDQCHRLRHCLAETIAVQKAVEAQSVWPIMEFALWLSEQPRHRFVFLTTIPHR